MANGTTAERAEAVRLKLEGKTLKEIGRIFGKRSETIARWTNPHLEEERAQRRAAAVKARARAIEMWHAGMRVRDIGKELHRADGTISYWLREARIDTMSRSRSAMAYASPAYREQVAEIGTLPDTSPLAEVDAAIMRSRLEAGIVDGRRRPSANPWPSCSSLV